MPKHPRGGVKFTPAGHFLIRVKIHSQPPEGGPGSRFPTSDTPKIFPLRARGRGPRVIETCTTDEGRATHDADSGHT